MYNRPNGSLERIPVEADEHEDTMVFMGNRENLIGSHKRHHNYVVE